MIKSNGGNGPSPFRWVNGPCTFKIKGTFATNSNPSITFCRKGTVSSFRLFNSLLKTYIKACDGAAASAFNMPWKSPPINSSGNVTIGAGSLWIPPVIRPLVAKLSLALIKTLFWLDARTSISGLPICFFWSSDTFATNFFNINFLWNCSCSISLLTFWKNTSMFFGSFCLKRNSHLMAAKSISIVSRAIRVAFNKSLSVDVNIMRKVIWREFEFKK